MEAFTINGITVDPAAQEPALAAANLIAPDASNTSYILVQTEQPLDRAQKQELAAKGVDILEYVPNNTYLCNYEPTDLDEIRALPYVAWANVYMQGFKIAPELVEVPPDRPGVHNLLTMTAETERIPNNTPKKVDVVFQRGVDPEAVRDKVATATRMDREDLELRGQKVRLTVPTKYLPDLANIDEVRHVEQVVPYKLHNDVARRILRVELDASGPDPAFEGEGQVVAVADTGFDRGSTTNIHPAFQGRVAKLYALGRPNNANDPNGHGTHVSGSVLGDGTSERLGGSIRGTLRMPGWSFNRSWIALASWAGCPTICTISLGRPTRKTVLASTPIRGAALLEMEVTIKTPSSWTISSGTTGTASSVSRLATKAQTGTPTHRLTP